MNVLSQSLRQHGESGSIGVTDAEALRGSGATVRLPEAGIREPGAVWRPGWSEVFARRVREVHYVCAVRVYQENVGAQTAVGNERNRLRGCPWDGSRSGSRRWCDVNRRRRVIGVDVYRCELT